jgi:hypothetical protein
MPQHQLVPGVPVHECRSTCQARSMFRRVLGPSLIFKAGVFFRGGYQLFCGWAGVWSDVTGVYGQSERRREFFWACCGELRHGDLNETTAANDSRLFFPSSVDCQTY